MTNVLRVALPTYNVKTETDIDKFPLRTDEENILIKEFTRGAFYRSSGVETIAHNLGYVPDFKVYVNDQASMNLRYGWKAVAAQNSAFLVNNFYAYADTTNIYIYNNSGINCSFVYYIFFDNQVGASPVTITESTNVLKMARPGINVNETLNPNDFLYHSDLNTFKILKESNASFTYSGDGVYTISHGLSIDDATAYDVFIKFPDGKTVKAAGENIVFSRDQNFTIQDIIITNTEIKCYIARLGGSGTSINVIFLIYETPLANSTGIEINPTEHTLRIGKAGVDVTLELDPNSYKFLLFNTLKYLPSGAGNQSITIVGDGTFKTTELTIAHNLGYVPYFTCFVDDFVSFPNSRYALAPYRNETLTMIRKSEVYADSTNLYLKMFNQSLNTYTSKFYYKIYRNKLNL